MIDNNFIISSGTGDVTLHDAVGAGTNGEVGTFKINAEAGTGNISIEDIAGAAETFIGSTATDVLTLTGTTYTTTDDAEYEGEGIVISGTNPTFTSNTKNIDFLDAAADKIKLGNSSNLTVNSTGAGNISFATDIIGTSSGAATDVTVNAGSGSVTVFAIGDATNDIGDISLTGATVNLKGDVVTAAWTNGEGDEDPGSFAIGGTSAVELFGESITIDTDNGDSATGGPVTFGGTVEAADDNGGLTISSGEGKVTFQGIIGGTDNEHLDALTINSTAGDGIIEIEQIGDASALGGIIGTTTIGNSTTAQIDFDGTIYKFDGGTTTITAVTGASDGSIDFTGGAVGITTFNDTLKFVTGVIDLDNGSNLTIATNGGAIEIEGIRGTSSETVSISANKGDAPASTTETILIGDSGIGSADQIATIDRHFKCCR